MAVKNYWLTRKSAVVKNGRPRRGEIPPGEVLCFHCPAKCCQYIALPIDRPRTWEGFDTVRWFLLHERTAVFVDNGQWYLLVYLTCKALRADGRCAIYPHRPPICRDYGTDVCEFEENAVYDQLFETPEQLEEYAEAILGPRSGGSIRTPCPGEDGTHDSDLPLHSLVTDGFQRTQQAAEQNAG
ncbi:MAG: YkgJ family cysteine cluster protein [Thermogutta sp.]